MFVIQATRAITAIATASIIIVLLLFSATPLSIIFASNVGRSISPNDAINISTSNEIMLFLSTLIFDNIVLKKNNSSYNDIIVSLYRFTERVVNIYD